MILLSLLALLPVAMADGGHHGTHNRGHNAPHSRARPAPVYTGQLVVHNPTQRSVQVLVDGRSYGYLNQGTMALTLNTGAHRVKLIHGGRVLNSQDVSIYRNERSSVRVRTPSVGQVWVTNHEPYPVDVYIDGRSVTTLYAGERRALDLGVGGHRVDLVDTRQYGGTVVSTSLHIDAWEAVSVSTPQRAQVSAGHQRPR